VAKATPTPADGYAGAKAERLTAVIRDGAYTRALRDGRVSSTVCDLQFIDNYEPINEAFRPMTRDQAFDICELAIVAFLQARAARKPLLCLPVVLYGGLHHDQIWYWPANGGLTAAELEGKRIGVRSYSQTTGVWVRGILRDQYAVDVNSIEWVTTEGSHVGDVIDPANVTRTAPGASLVDLLRTGSIDAVIGDLSGVIGAAKVITRAEDAEDWRRSHGVSINHLVALRSDLLTRRPDIVRDLYRMFCESISLGEQTDSCAPVLDGLRYGLAKVEPPLRLLMRYAADQGVIPAGIASDSFFPPRRLLDGS
jgi:4,5-dihydroxyphthalate decarboxylase